jgi:hypothetical protein
MVKNATKLLVALLRGVRHWKLFEQYLVILSVVPVGWR